MVLSTSTGRVPSSHRTSSTHGFLDLGHTLVEEADPIGELYPIEESLDLTNRLLQANRPASTTLVSFSELGAHDNDRGGASVYQK